LSDITHRAIETLKTVSYILCEDTRHSSILTKNFGITTRLESYHRFSEASKEDEIIESLKAGQSIALISDAGTPGICDPGERLVSRCVSENISVISIPGACALITALVASGLPTSPFQFIGFLPKKESDLITSLEQISLYQGVTVCYVSPHQIDKTLSTIAKRSPTQNLIIARELTKKFEEFLRGSAQELLKRIQETPIKGEVVLLFDRPPLQKESYWQNLTEQEHVSWIEKNLGLQKKEAIKMAADERGLPKRELYRKLLSDI
jgi:16S rRNA (cytidine1402-2'-O)-methyltransferase